jgi:acetyl esterase/lipase
MTMIMAIAPNTTYAAKSGPGLGKNADDFIADIPAGVKVIPDIAYRQGNQAWKLDLAMPKERGDAPRPAIVYIHGGGWTKGDKRGKGIGAVLGYAAKGFVSISVNYRLDADKKACVEDVKCAVRWLRAHAKKYNVDTNRIGAAGNSAGGHLALMLAVCPASAGLEGDGPYQEYSSMVQSAHCSSTPIMPGFRRGKGANQDVRKIQPMTYVSADVPPLYFIHGTEDQKAPVSYVDDFVKALRETGAKDITYKRYADGTGHGAYVKHIEETVPARETFFARTLKNKGVPNQGQSAQQKTAQLFERNDRNKDGQLSREEFPEAKRRLFDRIDTDKDGLISLQEDVTNRKSRSSQRPSNQRATRQQQSDRSRQPQVPAGTKVERDIVYARVGDRKLLLDLYLPPKGPARLPVIVWVHGGGWRGGSKGSGGQARPMLDRGFAVADVGYRLSGEAIFPAQVEDCKAAVRWVRANAAKYGLDPDRIGAWGRSAGGHLVAFLGAAGDVREFDTEANVEYSSRAQAVCDWFGPTDFLQMDKHSLKGSRLIHDAPNSPESLLVGGPIQEEPYRSLARKANPITYVTKDDPPFLIMHGDKDMSVPVHQSELLYEALKKAGVDATLHVVKGAGHGLRGGEESSEKLFEIVADFFKRHLKRDPARREPTQKPKADPKSRRGARKRPQLRPPTHKDVKYGPHERNVLDFYQAKSDTPTPVAVYIHGGGFRGGSKRSLKAGTLRELLDAGISVAAVEYRLVSDKPLPAAHHDSLRALQFICSKAKQWNIDKKRVGAFGGSAGAQICMWLAFHDEMAEPSSRDPVQRESSRLTCVATSGGQTTMDFDWWKRWIPEYAKPHRDRTELFGDVTDEELRKILKDISALSLITSDDPSIFMSYGMKPDDPVPANPSKVQGWKVHHVMFGVKLKAKMDELGVEADLKYPGAQTTYRSNAAFFITKLKPDNE